MTDAERLWADLFAVARAVRVVEDATTQDPTLAPHALHLGNLALHDARREAGLA